jgi:hypothetical protein
VATNKTIPNEQKVEEFLNAIEDEQKRKDSFTVLELMQQITGLEPQMWGTSIVGFGSQHYKYDSGREGDMPRVGFSPRKQNLTLYITDEFEEYTDLLNKLGKHSLGKSCLYIKRLNDVDMPTLKSMIETCFKHSMEANPD